MRGRVPAKRRSCLELGMELCVGSAGLDHRVVLHGMRGWRHGERGDEVSLGLRREVEVAQDEKSRAELDRRHALAVQKGFDYGVGLRKRDRPSGSRLLCS